MIERSPENSFPILKHEAPDGVLYFGAQGKFEKFSELFHEPPGIGDFFYGGQREMDIPEPF
jgi:hypothetical protein